MYPTLSYIVILLILALQNAVINAASRCYYPNGALAPNDMPCLNDQEITFCCREGYACLDNKLCQPPAKKRPGRQDQLNPYVRSTCTDKDWTNIQCALGWCTNVKLDDFGASTGLSRCKNMDDGKDHYQCTTENKEEIDCDEDRTTFNFDDDPPVVLTTIRWVFTTLTSSTISPETVASSQTESGTKSTSIDTTPTTNSLSDATTTTKISGSEVARPSTGNTVAEGESSTGESEPDDSSGWSRTRKIIVGSVIGGSLAVIVIGIIGGCTWFRRRRQRKEEYRHEGIQQMQTAKYPQELPSSTVSHAASWTINSPVTIHEAPSETTSPTRAFRQDWTVVPPQELPATPARLKRE